MTDAEALASTQITAMLGIKQMQNKVYAISINENIRRILITTRGTKTLRPEFGIPRFIDKRLDLNLKQEIKDEILAQISTYEPRIIVQKITLTQNSSELLMRLEYEELSTQEVKSISLNIL